MSESGEPRPGLEAAGEPADAPPDDAPTADRGLVDERSDEAQPGDAPPANGRPGAVGRRGFLGALVGGAAAVAGGAGLGLGVAVAQPIDTGSGSAGSAGTDGGTPVGSATVGFHGVHQAGVLVAPQAHCIVAAYDVKPEIDAKRLGGMLTIITDDIERMTTGAPALGDTAPELARTPSRLTVTIGFGPALLARLAVPGPAGFADLPPFPQIDQLMPEWSGGDLVLLIASDDAVTAAHSLRMLTKDLRTFAASRWVQRGFLNAAGSLPEGQTARNLMGQLDGTKNPRPGTPPFASSVWIDDGSVWSGGTTLVVRRIRMGMDSWDELDPRAMEEVIGRRLADGSPLTGTTEHEHPDLEAIDRFGLPLIRDGAHIRLARADSPHRQLLRRPYNYDVSTAGTTDMGQIFMAYQADIAEQYVPVQQRLAEADLLNSWTTPIGSAVFAIPPGSPAPGDILGGGIFG